MNTLLVESLVQAIESLPKEERSALEEKLFFDTDDPSDTDLVNLALQTDSFDFLEEEPDLYTTQDGEPI